jgi:branched-chain amino acid transport system substrate-binding protein
MCFDCAVAHDFSGQPYLLGVLGHYNSDTTLASVAICERSSLVVLTPIASNPEVTDSGLANMFRYTHRDDRTGVAIADHRYNGKAKRRGGHGVAYR